jgi:hypothetical protein
MFTSSHRGEVALSFVYTIILAIKFITTFTSSHRGEVALSFVYTIILAIKFITTSHHNRSQKTSNIKLC